MFRRETGKETDSEYQLYYVSEEKSRVVNTECVLENTGTEAMVTEMCTQVFEKLGRKRARTFCRTV